MELLNIDYEVPIGFGTYGEPQRFIVGPLCAQLMVG